MLILGISYGFIGKNVFLCLLSAHIAQGVRASRSGAFLLKVYS